MWNFTTLFNSSYPVDKFDSSDIHITVFDKPYKIGADHFPRGSANVTNIRAMGLVLSDPFWVPLVNQWNPMFPEVGKIQIQTRFRRYHPITTAYYKGSNLVHERDQRALATLIPTALRTITPVTQYVHQSCHQW